MSLDLSAPAPVRVVDRPDHPDVAVHAVVDRPLVVEGGESRPARDPAGPPITPQAADDVVEAVRRSLAVESGAVRAWSRWDLSVPVQDFVRAAARHRVIGIVASHGAATGLDPAASALLRPAVRAWAMDGLALAADTARLHRRLTAARLPHLVHKGAALAAQTTGRAEARGGGDLDLLLAAADAPAAHAMIVAAGWQPRADGAPVPGAGPGWGWMRFVDRERTYDGPGRPIDLHWRLGHGSALFPATGALLDRAVRVGVGGVGVPTLSPPDALLAACYTAVADDLSSARHLLDVARLLRLAGPDDLVGAPAAARRLVRDVTGLVTALLGPATARPAVVPACRSRSMPACWADGRVWAADGDRRVPPDRRGTKPLGRRLGELGRSLAREPGPASWARLVGFAALPSVLLADPTGASPLGAVLRRGGRRALEGCLPRR